MTHNFTESNAFGEETGESAKTGTYGSGMDLRFFGEWKHSLAFQSSSKTFPFLYMI
jgi:hypothetical protein